jgi:hypothetical protein
VLDNVASHIVENAQAANGDLDRHQQIEDAAVCLCDYVFEALQEWDISYVSGFEHRIDYKVCDAIQHIVAAAMLAQYEHDAEMWSAIIAELYKRGPLTMEAEA